MTIREQIARGALMCPRTRKPLLFACDGARLTDADGDVRYNVLKGCPIILSDTQSAEDYSRESDAMTREYSSEYVARPPLSVRIRKRFENDYRTKQSILDRDALFPPRGDRLYLAVGGGPGRPIAGRPHRYRS